MIGLYQHISYKGFPYGPFDQINKSIQGKVNKGDVIIHSSKLTYLPAFYFDKNIQQGFIIDPPNSSVDTLATATRIILNLNGIEDIKTGTEDAQRVWLIIYQQSLDEFRLNNKTHPHLEYLNNNFDLVSNETWDDVNLFVYARRMP